MNLKKELHDSRKRWERLSGILDLPLEMSVELMFGRPERFEERARETLARYKEVEEEAKVLAAKLEEEVKSAYAEIGRLRVEDPAQLLIDWRDIVIGYSSKELTISSVLYALDGTRRSHYHDEEELYRWKDAQMQKPRIRAEIRKRVLQRETGLEEVPLEEHTLIHEPLAVSETTEAAYAYKWGKPYYLVPNALLKYWVSQMEDLDVDKLEMHGVSEKELETLVVLAGSETYPTLRDALKAARALEAS